MPSLIIVTIAVVTRVEIDVLCRSEEVESHFVRAGGEPTQCRFRIAGEGSGMEVTVDKR